MPQLYSDNKLSRTGDITLDAEGNANGDLRFSMIDQEALHWRQVALRNDEDEVKKQFNHSLEAVVPEGVETRVDHFEGLDDPDAALVAFVKVKGSLGTATSKRILLPAYFLEARGSHPFANAEKRQEPVDMHYGEIVRKTRSSIICSLADSPLKARRRMQPSAGPTMRFWS